MKTKSYKFVVKLEKCRIYTSAKYMYTQNTQLDTSKRIRNPNVSKTIFSALISRHYIRTITLSMYSISSKINHKHNMKSNTFACMNAASIFICIEIEWQKNENPTFTQTEANTRRIDERRRRMNKLTWKRSMEKKRQKK